jgi:hypothetical protein
MDQATRQKTTGFATLQKDLASLVDALLDYTASATRAA